MFDEDDDYYDDEDDDYEDEEDEGGKGALILVGVLVLIAVGAVGFAIMLLTGGDGGGDETTDGEAVADLEAGGAEAPADAPADAAGIEGGFDFGDMGGLEGTEEGGGDTAPSTGSAAPAPSPRPTASNNPSPRPRPTTTSRPRNDDVVIDYSASTRPAATPRRDPTPTRSSSSGGGDTRDPYADSGTDETPVESASDPTETPPAADPVGTPDPTLSYEADYITSLAGAAGGGSLERNVVSHLQAVPGDHPNYWRAWATVMKNAEAKKDYRGHCEATEKVMTVSRFKYNPEFNLEMAKCHLRNGRLLEAVDNADRTIGNAMDLSSRSKTQRLLLAYKIRAKCRTTLYAKDAQAAAGLADRNKLNMAIQAWTDYSNYATGIGNTKAQQEADRELADLKARTGR